jgi:hypothetical protein
MLNKHSTFLNWLFLWATLTIVFNMTGLEIASLISFLILLIGAFCKIVRYYYRKWNLVNPLKIVSLFDGAISPDTQYLLIEISTKTKITIESFCLYFTNYQYDELSNAPKIKGLYNCLSGKILKDKLILQDSTQDNHWYWLNHPVFQQPCISLALAILCEQPFDGILKIDLSCAEINRIIYDVPFKITNIADNYNNQGAKGILLVQKINLHK